MTHHERTAATHTLAVMNRKGGVGKTSLAAALGSIAAISKERVLMIDLEPQANLSRWLLPTYDRDNSQLLTSLVNGQPLHIMNTSIPNLQLAAGGTQIRQIDRVLDPAVNRFPLLSASLAATEGNWDFIIIDGPPGDETLQAAALGTAPWVIAPTKDDDDSLDGVDDLASLMASQHETQPAPYAQLLGVVAFAWKRSATRANRRAIEKLSAMFSSFEEDMLFESVIWESSAAAAELRHLNLLPGEIPLDWNGPQRDIAHCYDTLYEEIKHRIATRERNTAP